MRKEYDFSVARNNPYTDQPEVVRAGSGKEQPMSTETESMHITPVGGNVFVDLGFAPEEAAALKAESQRVIAEKLVINAYCSGQPRNG